MKKQKMIAEGLRAPFAAPEVRGENHVPLKHTMLALYHRLAQANRSEFSKIQDIGLRLGITNPQKLAEWGAKTLAVTTSNRAAAPGAVMHAFKLGEASQLIQRATLSPKQIVHLRELAGEAKPLDPRAAQRASQVEQQREQEINQANQTPQPQPVQQQQQGPAASGALVQPWADDSINPAVVKLAHENGIINPLHIAVMDDMLRNPERSTADRARALTEDTGNGRKKIVGATEAIRKTLKLDLNNARVLLAGMVGMTPSQLVARVVVPGHPGLAQGIINAIPETHRDSVAKVLLGTYKSGAEKRFGMYHALKLIFSGEIWSSSPNFSSLEPLRAAFGGDRIAMLKAMGFNSLQILKFNPVGKALAKLMDPRLGTYTGPELAERIKRRLPTTRDESANLILTARQKGSESRALGKQLNFRAWIAIAVIGKNPTYTSTDLAAAYLRVKPSAPLKAAGNDLGLAFRALENHNGVSIERGPREDLQGRDYQRDNNTWLLQGFGLGRTSLSTGELEAIPTDFKRRSNPDPSNDSGTRARKVKPEPSTGEDTSWRDLLPLVELPPGQP